MHAKESSKRLFSQISLQVFTNYAHAVFFSFTQLNFLN